MKAGRFRWSNYGAIWRVTDPAPYKPVFSEDVLAYLVQLPRPRQRLAVRLVYQLIRHPFAPADYSMNDDSGRTVQHRLMGDFVLSYWLDHGSREVRIIDLEDAS